MVNTESHNHQTAENNWLWIVNINSQAGKWPSSHKRIIIWSIVHHWLRKIVCFSIKISSRRDADWWQGASLPIGERALGIDPQSLRKRPRRKTLKTYWALCHSLMDKMQVEKNTQQGEEMAEQNSDVISNCILFWPNSMFSIATFLPCSAEKLDRRMGLAWWLSTWKYVGSARKGMKQSFLRLFVKLNWPVLGQSCSFNLLLCP